MSRDNTSASGKAQREVRQGLRIEPLPWPPADGTIRKARRPHGHECLTCGAEFECVGPDETGFCAPVCPPCYWIELGWQLRLYESMVDELARKRLAIQRRIGKAVCRAAKTRRRKVVAKGDLVAAFGTLVVHPRGQVRGNEQRGTDVRFDSESPAS